MSPSAVARRERTCELARAFVAEVRCEMERAAREGNDLPPRVRSVHERVGHSTPEYRTLAVPIPPGGGGGSPEILSAVIAGYAARKPPSCLLLALDAVVARESGEQCPVLIAEARDCEGTRLFFMQPYRQEAGRLVWEPPLEGGWRDPGAEELILDAAFAGVRAPVRS